MRKNKGFTLMEMLIVVAIVAILIAIAVPTITTVLEKTREASDAANIRNAYTDLMARVITDDTSSCWDSENNLWKSDTVALSQTVTGWGTLNISDSFDSFAVQDGQPTAGGGATVEYDPITDIVMVRYTDESGASTFSWETYIATNPLLKRAAGSPVTMPSGYILSGQTGLTEAQEELVTEMKALLGWDKITLVYGPNGTYRNAQLITCVNSDEPTDTNKVNNLTATRIFIDKNTGEVLAIWNQKGSWSADSNGNRGFWGSQKTEDKTVEYVKES